MNSIIPQKTLAHLEWQRICERLADHCSGPVAAERARTLGFAPDERSRQRQLSRTTEARGLIDDGRAPGLGSPPRVAAFAQLAGRGSVLHAEALIDLGRFLESAWRTHQALHDLTDLAPQLSELAELLVLLPDLARRLRDSFDDHGQLHDHASGELGALRARVGSMHEQLQSSVQSVLRSPDYSEYLQDGYYTIREDRYVLPVRSGHKYHLPGIVHGSSQSGQTVYIEPQQVVEANNRLVLAQADVEREIQRILTKLSADVGKHTQDIVESQDLLAQIDLAFAAGRLSKELNATVPIAAPDAPLSLRNVRHPLLVLAGVDVVPNDLILREGQLGLVITGPNTGGKTVALKTVGLCALLSLAGLHIPADHGSTLPLWPAVYTDIGDEQSLQDHRSTFSAHLANLVRIRELAQSGSLVLLDELAVGTDPIQGAALAQAVLEDFVSRDITAITTTHFESLKALPFEDQRFRNAAVGFDMQAGGPTYRLSMDVPGASNALHAARRLGLHPPLVERAGELAGGQHQRLEAIIGQLEEERLQTHNARRAFEKQTRDLESTRAQLEEARARLQQKIRSDVSRERDLALQHAKRLREELERLQQQLRQPKKQRDAEWIAQASRQAQRASEEILQARRADLRTEAGTPLDPQSLQLGQRVWVLSLETEAQIVELPDDRAQVGVRAGIVTARVQCSDLRAVGKGKTKAAGAARVRAAQPSPAPAAPPRAQAAEGALDWEQLPPQAGHNTVDVRGQRADEAIDKVEAFIDEQHSAGGRIVFIIHGHGTGVLKNAVRQWLKSSPYVHDQRPGGRHEGGDGVTAAQLR